MIDDTAKIITTTDGVASAYELYSTYPIIYFILDDIRVHQVVHWSDGTSYRALHYQQRDEHPSKLTLSNKLKKQFSFHKFEGGIVSEVGTHGAIQYNFPYITIPSYIEFETNSLSYSLSESWSDGSIYTQVKRTDLMIDGVSFKEFLTNDGVQYPVVSHTTYSKITHTSTKLPQCFKTRHYTDSTSYLSNVGEPRISRPDVLTHTGVIKKRYSFNDVSPTIEYVSELYDGESKPIFPYITGKTLSIMPYYEVEYWSDGTSYVKT